MQKLSICEQAHRDKEKILEQWAKGMPFDHELGVCYLVNKALCDEAEMGLFWEGRTQKYEGESYTEKYMNGEKSLSRDELKNWVSHMENKDGTKGHHWTMEQTTEVAKKHGLTFEKMSECEWWVVLNMIYSDNYKRGRENHVYEELALNFVQDTDTVPLSEKLYYYYNFIVKHS